MKNRTIFSSVVLAFLVSAFFMSVSTVFGANPTGQPPAGVVGPTFSSISVSAGGNLIADNLKPNTNESLYVGGVAGINGITLQSGTNYFSLITGGTFSLGAPSKGGQIDVTGSELEVLGNISTLGNLNVTGDIANGTATDTGAVTINDTLKVNKSISVDGNVSVPVSGKVQTGKLEVTTANGISNPNNKLFLTDDVDISGNTSVAGTLSFNDILGNPGSMMASYNANVSGLLYVNKVEVAGSLTTAGNLSSAGHFKAASIGSFVKRTSSVTVAANSSNSVSVACMVGEMPLSCGADSVYNTEVYDLKFDASNGCLVSVKNNNVVAQTATVQALCFNPGN